MRRRDFITLLVGGVATWPLTVGAQQQAMQVIGYLSAGSPDSLAANLAAFREGLAETGIVEVQNVRIDALTITFLEPRISERARNTVHEATANHSTPFCRRRPTSSGFRRCSTSSIDCWASHSSRA
jgi:putative ABC transport system substrate-binding protein